MHRNGLLTLRSAAVVAALCASSLAAEQIELSNEHLAVLLDSEDGYAVGGMADRASRRLRRDVSPHRRRCRAGHTRTH